MPSTFLQKFLPLILSLLSVDAITQDFAWRDYVPGDIPPDAIEGAPGRYIGQVNDNGNLVATIFPQMKMALYDMYGRHTATTNIKILCSSKPNRFYWEMVDFNEPHTTQMKEAVKGGYQAKDPNSDIFIGKVFHENEWKIGKVVPIGVQHQGIWIWNQAGQGVRVSPFYLLKYNLTGVDSYDSYGSGNRVDFLARNA